MYSNVLYEHCLQKHHKLDKCISLVSDMTVCPSYRANYDCCIHAPVLDYFHKMNRTANHFSTSLKICFLFPRIHKNNSRSASAFWPIFVLSATNFYSISSRDLPMVYVFVWHHTMIYNHCHKTFHQKFHSSQNHISPHPNRWKCNLTKKIFFFFV